MPAARNQTATIRDRIKEFRRVRASDLRPNPKNWRTHPESQRDALTGLLQEIGYADALLAYDPGDGRLTLVDGHLRADTTPDQEVPVLVLDLSTEEADKLLAALDPLAGMAGRDDEILEALLRDVETDHEGLRALLDDLAKPIVGRDSAGAGALARAFGIPPFSILDARQGYWRERRRGLPAPRGQPLRRLRHRGHPEPGRLLPGHGLPGDLPLPGRRSPPLQ